MKKEVPYSEIELFENIKETDVDKLLYCIKSFRKNTCPNNCGFHAQISTNLFHLLGSKNQKFINKIEILSKGSTREKLLAYISQLSQDQNSKYVHSPLSRVALSEYLSGNRNAVDVRNYRDGEPVLVRYMAVRDKDHNYVGTLECVQKMGFAEKHFAR